MSSPKSLRLPLDPPTAQCSACVHALREALEGMEGVSSAEIGVKGASLTVAYDADSVSEESLRREAEVLGARIASERGHVTFKVTGLDCPDCARTVDKSVASLAGVLSADLVFASGVMVVEYEPGADPTAEILSLVGKMGYGIELAEEPQRAGTAEFRLVGVD